MQRNRTFSRPMGVSGSNRPGDVGRPAPASPAIEAAVNEATLLTLPQLRSELAFRGLDASGSKPHLVERLVEHSAGKRPGKRSRDEAFEETPAAKRKKRDVRQAGGSKRRREN